LHKSIFSVTEFGEFLKLKFIPKEIYTLADKLLFDD